MSAQLKKKFLVLILFIFPLLITAPFPLRAETIFLANFNNSSSMGDTRFVPDYYIGGTAPQAFTVSTAANETVALPAGTSPTLNTVIRVSSGNSSLDIHGGRDALYYTGLASGTFNRSEGTAEGFFQTPDDLSMNTAYRTFLSGQNSFSDGTYWYWQLFLNGSNQLTFAIGKSDFPTPGYQSAISIPIGPTDWAPNTWHHLAVTWKTTSLPNSATLQIFLDGKLMGKATNVNLPLTSAVETPNGNRINIGMPLGGTGQTNSGLGYNLKGLVDTVRLDNMALYDGSNNVVGDHVFTPPVVESGRLFKTFSAPSIAWITSEPSPTFVTFDNRTKGTQFTCDISLVLYRCNWDASMNLDLSQPKSISVWAYVTNAAAISSMTIYFQSVGGSQSGWYVWNIPDVNLINEGWNHFKIDSSTLLAHTELNPAGLNNINLVRISIWKPKTLPPNTIATVKLYDHDGSLQLSGERSFAYPEYDISPLPVRLNRRDANNNLLENRLIFDEHPQYLSYPGYDGVTALLDKISRAGFNTYVPNVWHGRGAIYQSPVGTSIDNVYASLFAGGQDPFADLLVQAHRRGINVQGWFSVALWQNPNLLPQYAASLSGQAYDLQNPAFRDFIVREIVEFAKKYDVDGINLDVIRTMVYSTTPMAIQLYSQRYPGVDLSTDINKIWTDPAAHDRFFQWQRDAVSDVVQRISDGIRPVKPWMVITVDGIPYPKPELNDEGRNEWIWVEKGWVDAVYSMAYARSPYFGNVTGTRLNSPFPERFGMLLSVWDPVAPPFPPSSLEAQIVSRQVDYFLKKFPESGVGLYLYSTLNDDQITALRSAPFKENALPFWPSK